MKTTTKLAVASCVALAALGCSAKPVQPSATINVTGVHLDPDPNKSIVTTANLTPEEFGSRLAAKEALRSVPPEKRPSGAEHVGSAEEALTVDTSSPCAGTDLWIYDNTSNYYGTPTDPNSGANARESCGGFACWTYDLLCFSGTGTSSDFSTYAYGEAFGTALYWNGYTEAFFPGTYGGTFYYGENLPQSFTGAQAWTETVTYDMSYVVLNP